MRDVPADVLSEAKELLGLAVENEALQPPGVIAAIGVACGRLAVELPAGRREMFELGSVPTVSARNIS